MKLLTISLLVVSFLAIGAHAQSDSDAVKINLGTAEQFAVLGATGITNISAHTYIIGDVGSSPTPAIVGLTQSQVKGHLYLKSNAVTAEAQKGLTVGYNQAADAPCPKDHDLTGKDLGGMKLGPGVYCFSTSAQLTGTLTLNAHGNPDSQWIFQVGSTLTTATNSKVDIILGHKEPPWGKGERGCGVYWQVGSSATIGSSNTFVGQILALASITLNSGVLRGKALASTGAVSISAQETVDGPSCGSAPVSDAGGMDFSKN
jgi:hypothetical protein